MDKSCDSGGESNRDQYLKQLNKLSHKISKPSTSSHPIIKKPNAFEHHNQPPPPPQQHQPPVYNINKNDSRDVVQKLTGSPAHDRFSTPPPIQQPKPPSSRLQRIRPPPLAHVSNRPPPLLSCAEAPILPPPYPAVAASTGAVGSFSLRPAAPPSPLPPFPAVHAAAESPVTAYMRCLQNSISSADPNSKTPQFSGFSPLAPLVSPRRNNSADTSQQQQPPASQQQISQSQSQPPPPPQFPFPPSPLLFGCFNSPRSPNPFLLFSPTSGQLNLPLSPTVPVPLPSPRWRGL